MKSLKPRTVLYRRKREARTNYKKRLRLLMGQMPRVVLRFTNQKILAQLITFAPSGDKVLVGVDSRKGLSSLGWKYSFKNIPAAYLTGVLFARRAVALGIKEAVLDTGFKQPLKGGKCFAFLKGLVDGGMQVPHDAEVGQMPAERLKGGHIAHYASQKQGKNASQFTQYLKSNAAPEQMSQAFDAVKQKVLQEKMK